MVYFKSHPTASELTTQFMEKKTQDWVTNGRSRKQNEREVRNSTQCSDSMESIEEKESVLCVCVLVSLEPERTKMSPVCMSVRTCVLLLFFLSRYLMCSSHSGQQKRNSGKNLTKCVSMFISSGYNIVS